MEMGMREGGGLTRIPEEMMCFGMRTRIAQINHRLDTRRSRCGSTIWLRGNLVMMKMELVCVGMGDKNCCRCCYCTHCAQLEASGSQRLMLPLLLLLLLRVHSLSGCRESLLLHQLLIPHYLPLPHYPPTVRCLDIVCSPFTFNFLFFLFLIPACLLGWSSGSSLFYVFTTFFVIFVYQF